VTLVLGAWTTDWVILGADTRVGSPYPSRPPSVDRKLFSLDAIGFVTFGEGPGDLPAQIDAAMLGSDLPHNATTTTVCNFLRSQFYGYPNMGALVGGFDLECPRLLRLSPVTGTPVCLPAATIFGSPENCFLPCDFLGPLEIIAQMLNELIKAASNFTSVAPPFEFLRIGRTGTLSFTWDSGWMGNPPSDAT
jgi:hypothetical protein